MASSEQLRLLRETAGLSRSELAAGTGYSVRQIARLEAGQSRPRPVYLQYLLQLQPRSRLFDPEAFTFIDLFAGIGGFRMGMEAAGGRCVFTSEWDRFAQETYRANFGDHALYGDIRAPETQEAVPDHDVLVAGFPCQPFSIAGVSKKNSLGRKHGFECDTQGTLFFDIEQILQRKRPKAFILENVKNLASHDGGRTFAVIMHTLRERLGYVVSSKVIDARSFVPQHRERIFIVGVRPDVADGFPWEQVELPDPARGPRLEAILHGERKPGGKDLRYTDRRGRPLPKYVLSDHLWGYLQSYASKHKAQGNGFGFGLVGPGDVARTLSARYYKDGSEILIRRGRGNPRRLTPRECARLMGFDQRGREPFRIVVSDTQAYKQFGNALVPQVVEALGHALVPLLVPSRAGQRGAA